jgi:hypothetical protein
MSNRVTEKEYFEWTASEPLSNPMPLSAKCMGCTSTTKPIRAAVRCM